VCIYMCPYARFQGAMFDQDTLIVAYDEKRGETRGARREATAGTKGDCIDCGLCVQVCPMGIDIRDGQQYQCITCALCVDACNGVMKKMNRPANLIGYTSSTALDGGNTRMLRPRIIVYGVIIFVLTTGMLWHMAGRKHIDLKVIKERQPLFVTMSDGSIQNKFTVKVANMTAEDQTYTLRIEGLPKASLVLQEEKLRVRAGQVTPYIVFVKLGGDDLQGASQKFSFVLEDVNSPEQRINYESVFFGPEKGATP
ncbi:MAG: 4Fe-4S dicluster domain-containing protein, partial [Nitrospirota bacterium]|nr:4Fe-4S dicluster domain-containing protein [Nitrospirota bacterium]